MSGILQTTSNDQDFVGDLPYEVVRDNDRLKDVANIFGLEKILSIDTENDGIDPHMGRPLLLQIATPNKCYIFEHYKGLDFSPLKKILENPSIIKLLFNAKYDWKWIFVHYGISLENIFCEQLAERLLTVGKPGAPRRPALKGLIEKYLGFELKKEVRSAFVGRDPLKDPIVEKEFAYAAGDTLYLFDIHQIQMKLLERDGLTAAVQLECEVLPIMAEAEVFGVSIDKEKWEGMLVQVEKRRIAAEEQVYKTMAPVVAQKTLFGIPPFNINSHPQLLKNFKRLGFDLPDTEEKTISRYKNKHPVFEQLLEWRKYEKIRSTYGKSLLNMISSKTGRLHPQFNLAQADSGRMSSEDPNCQNILGYDEDDPDSLNFRSCFIAKDGYVLIVGDFSQQELRVLADLSGDPTFYRAYTETDEHGKTLDIHRYTASKIFNIPYSDVSTHQRQVSKTVNFLLSYGGGAYTLAERLGISEDEAQGVIDSYFRRYSKIKTFLTSQSSGAISNGFITTISGRRRYFPLPDANTIGEKEYNRLKNSIRRQGANSVIQGSSADETKQAIVFVHKRLRQEGLDARILLVIHDELVVEVKEEQAKYAAKIVEEEMVRAHTHYFKRIPMVVDAHISKYWTK